MGLETFHGPRLGPQQEQRSLWLLFQEQVSAVTPESLGAMVLVTELLLSKVVAKSSEIQSCFSV